MSGPRARRYRLFSWEHSHFSGKVRAFLRYEAVGGALAFEDVLATPERIQGLLIPATGSNVVPRLQTPEGRFVPDSSESLDVCERAHPEPRVIPGAATPRQRLASHRIELLELDAPLADCQIGKRGGRLFAAPAAARAGRA